MLIQKTDPREFRAADFDYDLPEDRIAKYPLEKREESKLLIYKGGQISENTYDNIGQFLPKNALLVFNNSKVIPSRLRFENSNGGKIEVFCLEPIGGLGNIQTSLNQAGTAKWHCIVGGKKKWKERWISCEVEGLSIKAELLGRTDDYFEVAFEWSPKELSFTEVMERVGEMPIPPYFKRKCEDVDYVRYQTTFAEKRGSVAAPTAGLHFTEAIFEKLAAKQIEKAYTTLYVGAGTFLPVKSDTIGGHHMHYEWLDVSKSLLEKLVAQMRAAAPVIPVGTTSLRTLESLYWMGVKASQQPGASLEDLEVLQWEPYEVDTALSNVSALQALLKWMFANEMESLICKTQIIIVPSYKLRIVDAIVTNFHQPKSTLLLLVGAFVGNDWKRIYKHAMEKDFRFLSYGDGGLLFK